MAEKRFKLIEIRFEYILGGRREIRECVGSWDDKATAEKAAQKWGRTYDQRRYIVEEVARG